MSEWKEVRLGELTTKIGSGATPRGGSNSYKSKGLSLIRSQNVLDLQFSTNGLAFIDDNQADKLKNVTIEKNDISLNITGDSVARVCKVPDNILPARVNQHVAIIRVNSKKLISNFLLYNLISQKEELLSQSEIGATRKAITKGMIEKFIIRLPSLPTQKQIAEVLTSLDDKIDLLHRQNKTLEAMAETLFREWFVEGAEEDWEETDISTIAIFKNGKSKPKTEGKIPIYGGNGILGYSDNSNASGESIIIGRVGAYCGSLYFENKEIWVSDNAILLKGKDEKYIYFLFYLLKNKNLNSMAEGSSHPLLTQTLLNKISILIPSDSILELFNTQIKTWMRKMEFNIRQISKLEKLRDTLLPKLMSGAVKVSEL